MYRHLRYHVIETCQNKNLTRSFFRAVNNIVIMFRKIKFTFLPVFRIRIQIWSGFRWVGGSRSVIRQKFSPEKGKKENFLGWRVLCWAGGFSWSLNVLRRGPLTVFDKTTLSFALKVKKPWSGSAKSGMDGSVFSNCTAGSGSGFSKIPGSGPDVGNPDPKHRFLYKNCLQNCIY